MKKILLHPVLKKQISDELSISAQTVDMSLKYVFDSDTAKQIRKRAKELLVKESQNVKI